MLNIPNKMLAFIGSVLILLVGLCCVRIGNAQTISGDGLTASRAGDGVLITEGGDSILFYQMAPRSYRGEYTRSNYIHPLWGLSGEVLTEDFPKDHLHQRGIFWAWHQVYVNGKRVGDQWELEDCRWDFKKITIDRNGLPESIAIQAEVLWMSPGWTDAQGEQVPFVKETTTIEVHRRQPDLRKIDFTIELRALDGHVKIGGSEDVKGYGGFSARIRLPKGIRFTGTSGAVTPENTAVQAGPWVDFSGSFIEESVSGITIFTHPSLPNFPPPWILRSEASMQNPVFPGRAPVAVPTESPLTLRYRLVLHAGGPDTINPDSLQAEYSTLVE